MVNSFQWSNNYSKYWKNVWIMLKVNNKDTETSVFNFLYFFLLGFILYKADSHY